MKKRFAGILILTLALLISSISFADTNNVYVIPIKGEINRATYNFINNTLDKIIDENPTAIIFEIDTYGGLIAETEKIKNLIVSIPVTTISYVNKKAESAGVLITIASEKVVVSSSATIGSAEPIPNTEKVLSMWRSMLRDTAQYRNRDPLIVEAMADKDIVIEGLTSKGKLVNLTSAEAIKYGIADLTANSYEEILDSFGIKNPNIKVVEENLQVKLAKYISSPYVSTFLLTVGFIGLVIELLTPGFGIGGTISIISFGLYFGGNILAGNSNWTSLILFVTGLILLIIEAMVPGFGLPGISGIILVLVGIILAMDSLKIAFLSLSIAIIITAIVVIILIKMGYKSKLISKIVLDASEKDEKGYLSASSPVEYLNKEGKSITELRPAGFIEIDGVKLDALSDGSFIPKDVPVKVIRVEGSKIFVRRL